MGIAGAILAGVGGVCTALGIVNILEVTDTAIISDKLTWGFWFGLAVILFLAAITLLLGRRPGVED
jgi:hypothetical protein